MSERRRDAAGTACGFALVLLAALPACGRPALPGGGHARLVVIPWFDDLGEGPVGHPTIDDGGFVTDAGAPDTVFCAHVCGLVRRERESVLSCRAIGDPHEDLAGVECALR